MSLPVLLIVAILGTFAPEIIADLTGDSIRAWEFVATGSTMAVLWMACGAYIEREPVSSPTRLPMLALCAYGAFEAVQMPVCRLMFPMDRAPKIVHPDGLCAAAGIQTYELSPLLVSLLACLIARHLPMQVARSQPVERA